MKKQNLLITSALASVLVCPAFATGIGASAQSADCDNGVLGTYTGPASLSAQWTANRITLNWYDDSTENGGQAIDVVGTDSATCTYDGGIVLPENPEKTGYEFSGWTVRPAAPQQTLDCSIYNPAERNNISWGATYEYIAECESHSGCVWNENRRNYYEGECVNIIPVESTSYTTCAEITDKDTCLGLYADNGYSGHDEFESLCAFKNNKCEPHWEWGMGSVNITMPESFCEELNGYNYEDGYCYVDD
jgi:hypothetical protein